MPILPQFRSQFNNRGEKEIFLRASESGYFNSPKRVLIHSLRSHKTKSKVVGEIDFVYLDDQFVFFLESKGGPVKYDSSTDEWWILGGTEKGDPFKQVTDYLFYVRDYLLPEYFPDRFFNQRLIFGYGVMFPDVDKKMSFSKHTKTSSFKNETVEYDPEIIYTNTDHETPGGFIKYIEHLKEYWRSHGRYSGKSQSYGIGIRDVDEIRKIFRKDLIFEVPISKILHKEEFDIDTFTSEQFGILDSFGYFKQRGFIIEGGPGTGKTVLAKELLNRQNLLGKTCAYFCFNKNLSGEMDRFFKGNDKTSSIDCFNVHSFLTNALSRKNLLPAPEDKNYWSEVLPRQFKLWYSSLGLKKYDFIVIDEAQDIFSENLLDSIFLNLKDGVESGNWALFLDFKYQRFYKGFDEEYYKLFVGTYSCSVNSLPLNCRNHPDIVDVASNHSGLDTMPCRRNDVLFKTVVKVSEEMEKDVINQLKEWTQTGIEPHQITVLCHKRDNLKKIEDALGREAHTVSESQHKEKGKFSISTIHSYKGLENKFILIADIDSYDRNRKDLMSLFFVGYTRAQTGLCVLMDEKAQKELIKNVLKVAQDVKN